MQSFLTPSKISDLSTVHNVSIHSLAHY